MLKVYLVKIVDNILHSFILFTNTQILLKSPLFYSRKTQKHKDRIQIHPYFIAGKHKYTDKYKISCTVTQAKLQA